MKKHTARCEQHKDGPDFCTAGIDVSKQHLDAYELPADARPDLEHPGRRSRVRRIFCFNSAADSPQMGRRQAVANPREPSHENAVRRLGPPPFQSNLNRYAAQNRNTRIGDWKA